MSGTSIGYQNPPTTNVNLQSVQIAAGSPPTNAEVIVVGVDPTGTAGTSCYHVVSEASTNAANIKSSAGTLYGVSAFNNADYPVFVKFFNESDDPIPGVDAPVLTIGVQAGLARDFKIENGVAMFPDGIGIAITKGIADDDDTSVSLNDCVVDAFWI